MTKKKNNNILVLAGVGAAVYFLTKPVNAEDENDLFLAGNGGVGGGVQEVTGDYAAEGGLSKKQISYISQFDNAQNPTTVETFDFNGVKQNIVTTDISNLKAIESAQGFSTFASTPTDIYYKKGNDFVGGSSFITMQSITGAEAERRFNTRDNPIAAIARSSGGGSSKKSSKNKSSSSSGSSKSSSSSSKSTASISKAKDKVVRDYENKNLVSTTKTKKEIQKENNAKSFLKKIGIR